MSDSLDLDAVDAQLRGQRTAMESCIAYGIQIGPSHAWQMLDLSEFLAAELRKIRRGAQTLGETLHHLNTEVLDAVDAHQYIGADGDGDWAGVYELLAELRPDRDQWKARAESAEATLAGAAAERQSELAAISGWQDRMRARAEAAEAKLAQAWREGFDAGWDDAKDDGINDKWNSRTPNPYDGQS